MDPQQRLLLETTTRRSGAGIATDTLAGSATGVFVGITTVTTHSSRAVVVPTVPMSTATGSALARLPDAFLSPSVPGPCVAVDTACSSSLVAVHLACQSLRAGEQARARRRRERHSVARRDGAVFEVGMMAPDGACKTFDAAADGFVRAEGCAIIALRRLSDAVAAGDPILAVIRGSAVNSDGRSSGLTVPNGPAQQAVIRTALASAGLNGADIDYVEAHGTDASLGDPIEVEALRWRPIGGTSGHDAAAYRLGQDQSGAHKRRPAWGLLKVVLSLQHEALRRTRTIRCRILASRGRNSRLRSTPH